MKQMWKELFSISLINGNSRKTVLFYLLFHSIIWAQNDSIPGLISLDEVALEATRLSSSQAATPLAVSVLTFTQRQALKQQLSLQEYLTSVPGLFSLNAGNYAQDLRVSIRGFGARAAFGIRGIKIIVDGIPETTPDGQGQIDNLPLGLIQSIEVLRGPASSLYGNAAGGTLYINTLDRFENNAFDFRTTLGSFGMSSFQATALLKNNKTSAILYQNSTTTDGFRNNSGLEQHLFNAKIKHRFSKDAILRWQFNYTNSPKAEDAGGLTLDEATADRGQARQRNLDYDTYEKIAHLKTGLQFEKRLSPLWEWNSYGFYSYRDFYGKLPFENGGIVDLERNYFGLGTHFTYKAANKKHQLQIGLETASQKDQRDRYLNLSGTQGERSFSQLESFSNFGVFAVDEIHLNRWLLRTGLRYDHQRLGTDTTDNTIRFNVLNPSVGISYKLMEAQYLFAGIATSFEAPALSELSANPTGGEGFNPDLDPSNAINYELGWKWHQTKTTLEASVFYIRSDNEILPYELEASPGRSFYRNAGATQRRGIEILWKQRWKQWLLTNTFTQARYTFDAFVLKGNDLSGKELPGIPQQQWTANLMYTAKSNWKFQLEGQHVGQFYADNNNAHAVEDYQLFQLQATKTIALSWGTIALFGGVQNIFDVDYFDNIRLNAFGSRFYEPAPGRSFFGGLSFRF